MGQLNHYQCFTYPGVQILVTLDITGAGKTQERFPGKDINKIAK